MSTSLMNQEVVLQIGETRFAVRSDYDVFTKWLIEACENFLVSGNPHARLNLNFDVATKGLFASKAAFKIISKHDGNKSTFKVVCGYTDEHDKMFRSILNICLHCFVTSKQPPDLWLHSSGVVYGDWAYVFAGPSGSGKSTICNILAEKPGFTILHDEIIALSQTDEGLRAWTSPLRGERPARYRVWAPLRAVFFINHSVTNHVFRLNEAAIPDLLLNNLILPATAIKHNLATISNDTLNVVLILAEHIPCYELYFKPDFSFWEQIDHLLNEKSIIKLKGK